MNTTTSRNTLDLLAADAARLAQEARTLERRVADAVDVPACLAAREAALHLRTLAGLLTDAGREHVMSTHSATDQEVPRRSGNCPGRGHHLHRRGDDEQV